MSVSASNFIESKVLSCGREVIFWTIFAYTYVNEVPALKTFGN